MFHLFSRRLPAACLFILVLSLTSTASALEKSEVRDFIARSDVEGAEEAFYRLQKRAQTEVSKRKDQAAAYSVLGGTDPDIDGFLSKWLAEFPDSVHAHLARSKADYERAFRIRGTRFSKVTYPEALTIFAQLRARAEKHARIAYEIDPYLSEAAAHLLNIGFTNTPADEYFTLFQRIFADHPYYRHFKVAAQKTNPNWRGTWDQAEWLCENFAHKIKDMSGYTAEVCKVDLAFGHNHRDPRGTPDPEVFERSNSPALERYRSRYAFYAGPDDNRARDRALDAARNGDINNLELALEFDRYFPGRDSMFDIVYERKWAEAKREIVHDPYNSEYINVLRMEAGPLGLLPNRPSHEENVALLKRALVSHPFDGFMWSELADLVARRLDPDNPEETDPYYINGMVYSNFHPHTVSAYRFHREVLYLQANPGQLAVIRRRGDMLRPTGTVLGEMADEKLICPLIRITRFREGLCQATNDSDHCHTGEKNELILRSVMSKAGAQGICKAELKANLNDLAYVPYPDAIGLGIASQ